MKIRNSLASDAARIADLATQLGYPSTPEEIIHRLAAVAQDGSHVVFVAEDAEGAVVGWADVFELRVMAHDAVAELAGLVVDSAQRSSGIGKELLLAAEDWARVRGLPKLVLRSNVIRGEAHHFYEREGYERLKTQHVFMKKL